MFSCAEERAPTSSRPPGGEGNRPADRVRGRWRVCSPRLIKRYMFNRGGSIAEQQKRPRGRPPTGLTPLTGVRIPAPLEAKLQAWIEAQPDPKPSKSEAIRRLLETALDKSCG